MRYGIVFSVFYLCLGCLTPPPSFFTHQGPDYFPLDLERSWTFIKKSGTQTTEISYEITQEKNSVFLMRVRAGNKEDFASLHLRQGTLFLVRATVEGREEAQFLAKTLVPGNVWNWSTGTATVLPETEITVPAGSFQAIPVEYQRKQKIPEELQKQVPATNPLASLTERIWFVRHLGWVRIEQRINDEMIAIHELIRYAPPLKSGKE